MDVKEAVMRGGSRHVPARPGRAAGRSPARKPGKAPAGRSEAAADGASGTAAQGGRPPGPSPDTDKITAVAEPVVHALGMDLESVKVTSVGRRRLLRLVVDSDGGVSLDDAALASRELSAKLDASDVMGDMPYTLEVSSPGVDRPLTQPRHWQRAVGRLVRVPLPLTGAGHAKSAAGPGKAATGKPGSGQGKAGQGKAGQPGKAGTTAGGAVQGRVVAADAAEVTLDINGELRRFGYSALGTGVVQIEFARPGEPPDTGTSPEDRGPESRGPGAEPDGH
jgi:ribosome maturation factor RimP